MNEGYIILADNCKTDTGWEYFYHGKKVWSISDINSWGWVSEDEFIKIVGAFNRAEIKKTNLPDICFI